VVALERAYTAKVRVKGLASVDPTFHHGVMRAGLARWLPSFARPRQADPFVTLEMQQRLSRLAAELRELDRPDRLRMGGWHKVRAAQEAYERTLDDACRLAGLDVEPGRGAAHRLLAEAALESCGWRW
jgi:hypothetical protein